MNLKRCIAVTVKSLSEDQVLDGTCDALMALKLRVDDVTVKTAVKKEQS